MRVRRWERDSTKPVSGSQRGTFSLTSVLSELVLAALSDLFALRWPPLPLERPAPSAAHSLVQPPGSARWQLRLIVASAIPLGTELSALALRLLENYCGSRPSILDPAREVARPSAALRNAR